MCVSLAAYCKKVESGMKKRVFTMVAIGRKKSTTIAALEPNTRIVRNGDTRITRSGDTRVTRVYGYAFSIKANRRFFTMTGWNNGQ